MEYLKMGITTLVATELETAYDFWNQNLFEGKLPSNPYIGIRHRVESDGLYLPDKHDIPTGKSDEIMIDENLLNGDRESFWIAFVHQMIHTYQNHFGEKKPKNHYHDKEFARISKDLGLPTIGNDKGRGGEIGYSIDHTVDPNGRFKQVIQELGDKLTISITPRNAGAFLAKPEDSKNGKYWKYVCPKCEMLVKGKKGLEGMLACVKCGVTLREEAYNYK